MKVRELIKVLQLPATDKRVEKHTRKKINEAIKQKTLDYINMYQVAGYGALSRRLEELDREWDTERVLELNDAVLITAVSALGFTTRRTGWFILTGLIGLFLANHAVQGWCLAQEIIRALKIRTPSEINIERMAIKYLRGDFSEYSDDPMQIYDLVSSD
jgi:hypothetical protein